MTGPGSIGLAGAADVQCVGCVPGLIMRHIKVLTMKMQRTKATRHYAKQRALDKSNVTQLLLFQSQEKQFT